MPITEADFDQPFMCRTCGHIACVCGTQKRHKPKCAFRISATCAVGIECEHGRDVCPICDPCTCDKVDDGPWP